MTTRQFQITDILSDDVPKQTDKYQREFLITLYGYDTSGERVVCHVRKYKPYVYLKIPNGWETDTHLVDTLLRKIRGDTPLKVSHTIHTMKEFYGFHWNAKSDKPQLFAFAKLSFETLRDLKTMLRCVRDYYECGLTNPETIPETLKPWFDREIMKTTDKCDCNIYESFIHPVVRFIHEQEIDPTGFVSVEPDVGPKMYLTGLYDDEEFSCEYKSVKKADINETSPYVIASFDIECDSSHGDFPQTQKFFKKLATDIFDTTMNLANKCVLSAHKKKLHKESYYEELLQLAFNLQTTEEITSIPLNLSKHIDVNLVYTSDNRKPSPETLQTLATAIATHKPFIDTVGNADALTGKQRDKQINGIRKLIVKNLTDGENIEEAGDPVIQIGTVFHKYGTNETKRHIAVMGPRTSMTESEICDDLDEYDIEVERCSDEASLLLAWTSKIREENPDFITGYNIFGFDFKYLLERAKIVLPCPKTKRGHPKCGRYHCQDCPYRKFLNFGKIDSTKEETRSHYNKLCKANEKELTSSALGENTLTYIAMDGRILFDIQKEVSKGHSLESYKLDNVASHFMRGKLKEVLDSEEESRILTDTQNLKAGDYVSFRTHSNIGEELHKDGHKYQIKSIEPKTLILSEPCGILLEEFHKVEWCLNKDDITPQDIFDKHKMDGPEGAKGRAEVAKYCVQDCELCIDLLLLLDLIPNNLAMANVSYVPVSYIFLRGQGVKVSSVVAKTCDDNNTRIPDLRKSPFLRDYVKLMKEVSNADKDELLTRISEISDEDYAYLQDNSLLVKEFLKLTMKHDNSKFGAPKDWILDEWYEEVIAIHQGEKGMEGYEGAIVLDPKPGLYLEDPIAVLDYASLYPSSIIEKNISHETQVDEDFVTSQNLIEDVDYYRITYENWMYRLKGKGNSVEKCKNEVEPEKICYFLTQSYIKKDEPLDELVPEDSKGLGIIPKVLEHLLDARKSTKKRMKSETDEFKYKVLDGLQLAYKVTANSVYGQLGARTSPIYKMNLAACTTAIGRARIDDASKGVKQWAAEYGHPEPDIVYGDSVLPDTPLLLRKDGNITFKQIDDLSQAYVPYERFKPMDDNRSEKQQSETSYEIMTSGGWSKINRVIRHKTRKKIYRITTHTSVSDVTEDHSLLDDSGTICKPGEVSVGQRLLHRYPSFPKTNLHLRDIIEYSEDIGNKSLREKECYLYGFFYGDGSCGGYDTKHSVKYSWAINQKDIHTCSILQSLLIEVYDGEFDILDTLESSGVHKIVPKHTIKKYVEIYRPIFYNKDKYKIIPDCILNGTHEERFAFLCGYYGADGYKCRNSTSKNIILTNKGKIGTAMLYYLAKSLGLNVSVNGRKDKRDIFKLTCTSNLQRKNPEVIKKIDILHEDYVDFVYDIETEYGNFNTGFECIVKNTDSVFVKFSRIKDGVLLQGKEALKHCIDCGQKAGEYVTLKLLKNPQDLEYEKTFWPFILISKKRYTGDKYEFDPNECKRTSMGIVLKRRDNAPIVKYVFGNVIEIIMIQRDFEKVREWLIQTLKDILGKKFEDSRFVITKALRGYYKNPQQIAHKVLADRMAERDPGNKPKANDRIAYAYIQLDKEITHDAKNPYKSGLRKGKPRERKVLQGDRIEHIDYIRSKDLEIDYQFYITNQIMNPVKQVLDLHMDPKESEALFQQCLE